MTTFTFGYRNWPFKWGDCFHDWPSKCNFSIQIWKKGFGTNHPPIKTEHVIYLYNMYTFPCHTPEQAWCSVVFGRSGFNFALLILCKCTPQSIWQNSFVTSALSNTQTLWLHYDYITVAVLLSLGETGSLIVIDSSLKVSTGWLSKYIHGRCHVKIGSPHLGAPQDPKMFKF